MSGVRESARSAGVYRFQHHIRAALSARTTRFAVLALAGFLSLGASAADRPDEDPAGTIRAQAPGSSAIRGVRVTHEDMLRHQATLGDRPAVEVPYYTSRGPAIVPSLAPAVETFSDGPAGIGGGETSPGRPGGVPEARDVPRGPAPPPEPAPPLLANFPGIGDNNTAIPPDTHGAAGPNHLASILNNGFAVFDKTTGAMLPGYPVSLQSFWSALGTNPGDPADFPFDPKIIFDQYSGRFIAVTDSNPQTTDSYVLVGVSDTNDPSGTWTQYAITADPANTHWADYPGVGVGPDWIYITNNMFPVTAGSTFARIYFVDKSDAIGGTLTVQTRDVGAFTVQPCHAFGPTSVNYGISSGWSGGGTTRFLKIHEFSFPGGTATVTELGYIRVTDYGADAPAASGEPLDDAPQGGCAEVISTNDDRLLNAVLRNGKIWTTHEVDDPNADGTAKVEVAWYEIDPGDANPGGSNGPVQEGRVSDPDLWYYFPSIAVTADECAALGFSGSSSSSFAGGYYTMRKPTDPAGSMRTVGQLKAGEDPYYKLFSKSENRWGDYSATMVDPSDNVSFWTFQEYAETETGAGCPTVDTGVWGTWWGKFECVASEQNCDDNLDDDGDTLVDEADPDCGGCDNETDDNSDGEGDAEAAECIGGGVPAECTDGLDNESVPDGLIDEGDPGCWANGCTDGIDNDGNGCTDGADLHCGGNEIGQCGDSLDNDCDGEFDCNDSDCNGDPACPEAGNCFDLVDNDNDGCTDGADSECGGIETLCKDFIDNDCDGQLDCADPDCIGDPQCPEAGNCGDTVDNDGDGCTDTDDVDCGGSETICNDTQDDDCDGATDCSDVDCSGDPLCPESANCSDGVDNDIDGCTDGEDVDCGGTEISCTNGNDDDCDGDQDCVDSDCLGDPGCPEAGNCGDTIDNDQDGCTDGFDSECGGTELSCNDNQDDDCDGLTDCNDLDCDTSPFCPESVCDDTFDNDLDGCIDLDDSDCGGTETNCSDNLDEDCDTLQDCDDPDCTGDPACPSTEICDDTVDNDVDGCTDAEDSDCGGTETACGDLTDNDCDNMTDCRDIDCLGDPACPESANCRDNLDNDLDGCTDRADVDCGGTETSCGDGIDNNCDGTTDCDDPACAGDPACPETGNCSDGIDNDQDGCTDAADVDCGGTETVCDDTQDSDCDGAVDCADTDCLGNPLCPESANCADGLDNDLDGCTDTGDSDCGGIETICSGGLDEDCDLLVDCRDPDCGGSPSCPEAGNCADGIDNDQDGCTDTADADCGGRETICTDSQDSDCDGAIDCADVDCLGDPGCPEAGNCGDGLDNDLDGCFDLIDSECGGTEGSCTDTADADCDGAIDCADTDCNGDPACPETGNCSDGLDNDLDGCTDGFDVDCGGTETLCLDGTDDDCDGIQDCLDPDCFGDPICVESNCGDGIDNEGDGCVDGDDSDCGGTEIACGDGRDDDCDRLVDCADPDCNGDPACPETGNCGDGNDNDQDGLIDCEDPECEGQTCADDGIGCTLDICRTGVCRHAERDSLCDDGLFCTGVERCVPGAPEAGPDGCVAGIPWCIDPGEICSEAEQRCIEVECRDGLDNNGNGVRDCADPDCPGASPEICDDNFDNDCNGLTDCEEPICGEDLDGDGVKSPPCGNDCDDGDPSVHPGRNEDCETPADDDCDGFPNCSDTQCQFDRDGDGQFELPCGEDCDDNDPNNWFRQEEDCTDRQDNNCNADIDCADLFCDGRLCDDGAACTSLDTCSAGECVGMPDHNLCDDGLYCTGVETCDPLDPDAAANGCLGGDDPCQPWQECREATRECVDQCAVDAFEPDDGCNEANLIVPGETEESQDHSICPGGDVDRFRFLAEEGATYLFRTEGSTDTRGEVRSDDCGTVLAVAEQCDGDDNFCIEFTAAVSGFHTVAVMGQVVQDVGDYAFLYGIIEGPPCVPDAREPDDTCGDATALNIGPAEQALVGSVCPGGDVDTFRFFAQEGLMYRFETAGTTDTRGRIETPGCVDTLVDESRCGDDPLNFCIFWKAPSDGDYVLRVQGRQPGEEGDYVLRYAQSPCPRDGWEPDDACDTATVLTVDFDTRRQAHTICPGEDLDFFEFFATGGADYEFWSEGPTDTAGAVLRPGCDKFEVKNASCAGVDENFCLRWTAPSDGTWKLAVTGGAEGGPYDLYFRRAGDPTPACSEDAAEPDDTCAEGTTIVPSEVDQVMSRTICQAGDRDHFTFEAMAGRTYSFWTTGPTDTRASVRGAGCGKLQGNDDCDRPNDLNMCMTWTAPADGTYHVRVIGSSAAQTTGGYLFHYRLMPVQ